MHGFRWGLLLLAAGLATGCSELPEAPGAQRFEFALIGDVPYQALPGEDDEVMTRLVAALNTEKTIEWILHSGDIKGTIPCSDEVYRDRLSRFRQFNKPFLLTPGDNDWTDCHRRELGAFDPIERLAQLRAVFYADVSQQFGNQRLGLISQSGDPRYAEFSEHLRWVKHDIVFATLHVVGSENGLRGFSGRTGASDEEVSRRITAAIAWMDETFRVAREHNSPGVFLLMHANPGLEFRQYRDSRDGFIEILAALERNIVAYGRPVVLAHGDTHYFRIDKPRVATGNFLPNFTRVENFGPLEAQWVRITVEPHSPEVFSFEAVTADH
ncbi:MAG: hypothetical protein AB1810_14575 [Pseudomonadota bacterium]